MKIYDRLYKEMQFPMLISDLLFCPGLLRLRDVRMANNQFVAFPAFASTTRYEHSLGVCYLAGKCAHHLNLSETETLELMLACLYHDVGTPPFAHAMEEVLQRLYGFDHEENLRKLIIGDSGEFDGENAQIFGGKMLRLRSACQRAKKKGINIDLERIANIATGNSADPLSLLVCGKGMDLDNIDNIIRASTAMGIININYPTSAERFAYTLAKSFVMKDGNIYYDNSSIFEITEWQRIRDIQYTAIFESIEDFAYQTMIKQAIKLFIDYPEPGLELGSFAWRMTDSVFTNDFLLKHSKSRTIMRRVIDCDPFNCLGVLYICGDDATKFINKHLSDIEMIVSEYLLSHISYSQRVINGILTNAVVANFYPDKRKRSLANLFLKPLNNVCDNTKTTQKNGALLGLFTPLSKSGYITTETNGEKKRKATAFSKGDLENVIQLLSGGCLHGFAIEEYRGEPHGHSDKTEVEFSQLGLFGLQ